jgi:hypothetical protein
MLPVLCPRGNLYFFFRTSLFFNLYFYFPPSIFLLKKHLLFLLEKAVALVFFFNCRLLSKTLAISSTNAHTVSPTSA